MATATQSPSTVPAGTYDGRGYEIGNALGAVWAVAPRLAAKLTRRHNYAKAVQTYLRAVDFYCEQHGISPHRIRIDTTVHEGRIVQRISG